MATILVIDDEEAIRKTVEASLKADGNEVYLAEDGVQGWVAFRRYRPDLVILDTMLPTMNGLELLHRIRRESDVCVLMLTAKSEAMDRVTIGADDYLTKPFNPRELAVRVKVMLRRRRKSTIEEARIFAFKHIRIDVQRREVWRDGEPIDLTTLEFNLLSTLAAYAGTAMSREQLFEKVWGYDFYGGDRVVDVHIGHIRQKLEYAPTKPQFILTVRGVGYKFGDVPP
ncbi:MAG TPA: response regulator transcription factor [Oceanobacillus sp.]|nr:response regulator transcription factor [Oceanobacillus sp.]